MNAEMTFGLFDSGQAVRLPGLVDAHVHLRVPGGEHKEDFRSGTRAALAGGFTQVLAMPNTHPPLTTLARWQAAQEQARQEGLCEVHQYCGVSMGALPELEALGAHAPALKVYMDPTYGDLKVGGLKDLRQIIARWPTTKVIAIHAEGGSLYDALRLAEELPCRLHICHVSLREEIEAIARAKGRGLAVTCEVTPHHLFLTEVDAQRLGALGDMRPRLASTMDVDALWEHLQETVDLIATDHAPHTLEEKAQAVAVPPGVPGLESSLPLMLTAMLQGRLSLTRLIELMYSNPLRIFDLPVQTDTWVEASLGEESIFPSRALYTRCAWSPFSGRVARASVRRVVLRGQEVLREGRIVETHQPSKE